MENRWIKEKQNRQEFEHNLPRPSNHPLPSKMQALALLLISSIMNDSWSHSQVHEHSLVSNFYRRFIPCANILNPLNSLLTCYRTPHMRRHLYHCQSLLVHPKPNTLISLATDTSDSAIGAVLKQNVNGQWWPIQFFSKKMKSSERW